MQAPSPPPLLKHPVGAALPAKPGVGGPERMRREQGGAISSRRRREEQAPLPTAPRPSKEDSAALR